MLYYTISKTLGVLTLIARRIQKALTTAPRARNYFDLLLVSVVFGVLVVPFGLWTGFLEISGPQDSLGILMAYSLVAFVLPATAEELVFRVVLLPHKDEKVSLRAKVLWTVLALIVFVMWHPVNAYFFLPWTRSLFYRWDFLVAAAFLGFAATVLYFRSGSIWPGVIFHWAVVVGWKMGCGGRVITFGEPVG